MLPQLVKEIMYWKDKVLASDDMVWLRSQLLGSQTLNQELHRRLQSCEGADIRLEQMRDDMKKELKIQASYTDFHRKESKKWATRAFAAERKLDNLPFWIRWFIESK